jgi:molybdopterin synthase catalytic subunit
MKKSTQKVFVHGAVSPQFIADAIAKHQTKTTIGAHSLFLGQVRADEYRGQAVTGIEYSAYVDMAEEEFQKIREELFAKYTLSCMHIYHSLGLVKTGELSLFVFVSSKHRTELFAATEDTVQQIKSRVPIWGKELLADGSYVWKKNELKQKEE